ncbi:hypothetical protein [Plantactinospora sonchi]|uniref:Uncharacterized protein n=1 Tax=Plantactinospora sonchi TaxID=1544735 RepID=A0ABU7S5A8_9ACTN
MVLDPLAQDRAQPWQVFGVGGQVQAVQQGQGLGRGKAAVDGVIAAEQGAENRRTKLGDSSGGLIDVALVVPADRTRVFQDVAGAQVQRTDGQLVQAASLSWSKTRLLA